MSVGWLRTWAPPSPGPMLPAYGVACEASGSALRPFDKLRVVPDNAEGR
jgi:hypothetical protein